jgi:hypothetical protein
MCRLIRPKDSAALRTRRRAWPPPGTIVLLLVVLATACGSKGSLVNAPSTSGKTAFVPPFHPGNFHHPTEINNRWFPIAPGATWLWQGEYRGLPYVLEQWVPNDTRLIDGVVARPVIDKDTVSGTVIGGAIDYYAQDDDGNVWYLAEETTHYVNGQLTDHADSWVAGLKGARPGIFMPAVPRLESPPYQQEFAPNLSADVARVAKLESVCVPLRCFDNVVEMHETSVLDPGVVSAKYYAPGAGLVKENVLQGDPIEYHLVSITPGAAG